MTTVLLIFIYLIYIGLGVPDSVVGPAWTTVSTELSIPLIYESLVTSLVSLCTVVASFFSAKIINKFGAGKVTAFSTLLTSLALLGYSFSNSLIALCLCAIPSGLGAGAIDAALNNYVSANYKPAYVNFLHCFYGIGVSLSPYVFSFTLKDSDWRQGYRIIFLIQLTITAISFIALIFWKRVTVKGEDGKELSPVTLKYKQMFKNRAVRTSWLIFFSTCSLEFTCGHWGASYMELGCLTTADRAALVLSIYFIGITVGRFIAGLLTTKINVKGVIFAGYTILFIGLALLFIPSGYVLKGVGFFLIGFGNGPTFPNLSYLTPKYFGKKYSQSIISSQMVTCNIGITFMSALFGVVELLFGINAFPFYLSIFFVAMIIATIVYFNMVKKEENRIFS